MRVELKGDGEFAMNQWCEFSLTLHSRPISIMVCKTNSGYKAFENFCPHQGRRMDYAPDEFLTTEQGNIICPAHGAEFETEHGSCINGPCKGESLKPIQIEIEEHKVFAHFKE